jgi:hypothetical protein
VNKEGRDLLKKMTKFGEQFIQMKSLKRRGGNSILSHASNAVDASLGEFISIS